MPQTEQQPADSLRMAVEQFLLRRLRGDVVSISQFINEFPEFAEFKDELVLGLKQAELVAVAKSHSFDERLRHGDFGSSHGQLHLRCPHCQSLLTIDADRVWSEVTCESCAGTFSLIEPAQSKDAPSLSELAHFELLQRVGIGAFGTVWRAHDTKLDRIVALKIPRKGELSEKEMAMFMREAQAEAQILHPNVVRVYEVGRHDSTLFIASEFIEGPTLAAIIGSGRLTVRESTLLIEKVARGLHAGHEAGVTHRDLKPGNILVDAEGEPHVTDFGLAKRDALDVLMTVDGALVGTPAYMAPEQASGTAHDADARSDVYSLGVILFQLLTGELPFRGTVATLIKQVIDDEPPSPRKLNLQVPRDLETICLKCLEKKPTQRFQTAAELADELQRFRQHQPINTRPVGVAGRVLRWTRRRPTAAALAFALASSLVVGSAVSIFFALTAQRHAIQLADNVERLKNSAYAYEMTEVQRAVNSGNTEVALRSLEKYAPGTPEAGRRGPEWHHWWRSIYERQLAIYQTDQRLRGLAISPDDAHIVWGNAAGELHMSDLRLRNVRRLNASHGALVQDIKFSPDGQWLYSLSVDGRLLVTDFEHDRVEQRLQHPNSDASALGMSHDGQQIAVGGAGETDGTSLIMIWRVGKWDSPRRIEGPNDILASIHWTVTDEFLIVGAWLGLYKIAPSDLSQSGSAPSISPELADTRGATSRCLTDDTVIALHYSPTDESSFELRRADGRTGESQMALQPAFAEGHCGDLQISDDQRWLALPNAEKTIPIYDLTTGQRVLTVGGHRDRVTNVEFTSDSNSLVSVSEDGSIRIWDVRPDFETEVQLVHQTDVTWSDVTDCRPLAMSNDGSSVAIAHENGVSVWQVPKLDPAARIELTTDSAPSKNGIRWAGLRFSRDSRSLAGVFLDASVGEVTGHRSTRCLVWSLDSQRPQQLVTESRDAVIAEFSTDGQRILLGRSAGRGTFPGDPVGIELLSLSDADFHQRWQPSDANDPWQPHRMGIADLCCTADGQRVYSVGGRDRMLKAWHYPDGELLFSFRRENNLHGATRVAVSPDAQTIAVGWADNLITLVDAEGFLVSTLVGHNGVASQLSFTADGRTLVSGSNDKTIKIWDATIGQLRTTLTGHAAPIVGCSITPDGHWIVSLDSEGELRRWNCLPVDETGQP